LKPGMFAGRFLFISFSTISRSIISYSSFLASVSPSFYLAGLLYSFVISFSLCCFHF
jgi:hypothetical protein